VNYVMTAAHLHIQGKFIPAGTILPVEDANGFWRVVSGPYEGIKVAGFHCTTFPLYQEVLQLREEVAALTKHNEYLVKRVESQDKAIVKWEKAWEKERDEKRMLQEEINQLVAEKKVVLPPEVANALDKEFGSANEEQKQWGFSNIVRLHPIHLSPEARKIKDYFHAAKYLSLARALIYGYTVEQTLEQRIRQGVQKIYEQWTQIPSTGDDQADGSDLAERITKFVAAELKL
jgi:hypothetical protein